VSKAPDPYQDPASGVLRNLLTITDPAELAEAEAALSASRLIDLELRRLPGIYDLDHLRAFPRYILGDVLDPALNVAASAAAHRGDIAPLSAMLDGLVVLSHPPGPLGPGGGRAA
jgi:hypothetical protein